MNATTVPVFPLSTVLFPDGPLQLRIFETRYVDMVRRCMRERGAFGVVMIHSGSETGPVTAVADIGTTARIIDFSALPDGLLGISCLGERRFRIVRRWQQSDGLNLADIECLQPETHIALPPEHEHLGELLRKVLPELGQLYVAVPKRFGDAAWVACRMAEILPLSLADKQRCLELDDPLERLALVSTYVRRVDLDE